MANAVNITIMIGLFVFWR